MSLSRAAGERYTFLAILALLALRLRHNLLVLANTLRQGLSERSEHAVDCDFCVHPHQLIALRQLGEITQRRMQKSEGKQFRAKEYVTFVAE